MTDRPKIEMLPVPDVGHIYSFRNMMLDRVAAAFALPYHLLAPGPIIRTHIGDIGQFIDWDADRRTRIDAIWRKALQEHNRRHETACWVYLVGYDPQKLLEHKP